MPAETACEMCSSKLGVRWVKTPHSGDAGDGVWMCSECRDDMNVGWKSGQEFGARRVTVKDRAQYLDRI